MRRSNASAAPNDAASVAAARTRVIVRVSILDTLISSPGMAEAWQSIAASGE